MARVEILGAGISGHTAALHQQRQPKDQHQIVMVSPNANWNGTPSDILVGVGKISADRVRFPSASIYNRKHIEFRQVQAVAIHPEGDAAEPKSFVEIVYTDPVKQGYEEKLIYD